MDGRRYTISGEIFARFPGYVRGVVVARDLRNGPTTPEVEALLRDAEAHIRGTLDLETLTADPRIASWRAAFKALGIKPNEFRCSTEAMARRVLRGGRLPAINTLVDLGNALSLRTLVPVGSHAIDHLEEDLALRLATGAETFVPFGTDQPEHPDPGEVVFVEGGTVLTRRWSWRQSNHTLTLPGTTAIEFNVDGLPPVPAEEVAGLCEEVAGLIRRHCGGRTRYEILSQDHPEMSLARET